MSTIVLTGGGTAGHIIPNLALVPYLREHFDRIIYIGSDSGLEQKFVSAYPEIQYYAVTTVRLLRSLSPQNLLIPFKMHRGKREAKKLLASLQPDIIFSKGGYVALPVTQAGKKLNIPIICHESDYTMGLANKLGSRHCCAVCTTFRETADTLNNGVFVGSPFAKKDFTDAQKQRLRQKLNVNSLKPICLVLGGSQGAQSINDAVCRNLDYLLKTHQIIHLTGKGKMTNIKKDGYHPLEFSDELPLIMSICDLAITRGGSNALYELLSYGIPMLIIPLHRGSRGDQEQNALYFEKKGYAITMLEPEMSDEKLIELFAKLIKTAPAIRAANKFATPTDSLQRIMAIILKYRKNAETPTAKTGL